MQILVLGMHRSGTSAVTRLVNMMGAYFGPENSAGDITSDNPKGFWERPEVFKLNESLLAARGAAWQDLRRWEPGMASQIPEKAQYNIKKLLLGMDAHRPWVLKDPRMCLMLPAWLPHLEAPIALITYRHPAEIALSLQKRDGFSAEYAMALWEYYSVTMLNASLKLPRIFIRHADLLERPVKTAELLYAQLREAGVRRIEMPSAQEIQAFIDAKLYRSRPETQARLTPEHHLLCDMLQGNHAQTALLRMSAPTKALIRQGPQLKEAS